jgi:hypothetical protein
MRVLLTPDRLAALWAPPKLVAGPMNLYRQACRWELLPHFRVLVLPRFRASGESLFHGCPISWFTEFGVPGFLDSG